MTNRLSVLLSLALAVLVVAAPVAHGAAVVTVVNNDGANEGFNDPTPVAPVGGNAGTTLGQQRLIVFQYAAQKWGQTLDSVVPIFVRANFDPLTCTPTSAVLGSAGALEIFANFPGTGLHPGALYPNAWHGGALANKRAGADLSTGPEIGTRFNSNLGLPGCLTGRTFYLGLDANHGNNIDLAAVVLHELGHGMGFQQFASVSTGAMILGLPDVYNTLIFDNTQLRTWPLMTDLERRASAINARRVTFHGNTVTTAVPSVLQLGTPVLRVSAPAAISGTYAVGAASFGPALGSPGVTAALALADDGVAPANDACTALTNAAAVAGKIAVVDRGLCGFTVKAAVVQAAGAIGMVVVDNAADNPPPGLGGADPTITIPSVRITLADGITIKAQLGVGVTATLGVDQTVYAGADPSGFALLNAPNPVQPGSSISHWDPITTPNQIMEPSINAGLPHVLAPPADLTLPLMRDIGWYPDADLDGVENDQCPASNQLATVVIDGIDTGVPNPMFTSGCTVTDLVVGQATGATNHGGFVSGVARLLNALRDAGVITGAQRGAIQSAAARANLP